MPLMHAAWLGDLPKVKLLLQGARVKARVNKYGDVDLMYAVQGANLKIIELFIHRPIQWY